jgi:hypothetical protein
MFLKKIKIVDDNKTSAMSPLKHLKWTTFPCENGFSSVHQSLNLVALSDYCDICPFKLTLSNLNRNPSKRRMIMEYNGPCLKGASRM